MPSEPPSSPAIRRGWWIALVLGCLFLISVVRDPAGGVVFAAIFFAVAWGIRRRQVWAAAAGAAVLALGIAATSGAWGSVPASQILVADALLLALMALLAAATLALWRDPRASRHSAAWPAFLAVLVLYATCTHPYFVSSGSMANTLLPGDCILAQSLTWRLGHAPQRGDVVEVQFPENPRDLFIKRVVGVPGDRLHFVNKQLYRNGRPVVEPYAIHQSTVADNYRDNFPARPSLRLAGFAQDMLDNHVRNGEVLVPPGQYFVLGDNRDDSLDSRYFGFISRAAIVASPMVIYQSFNGAPAANRLRWNRIFKPL